MYVNKQLQHWVNYKWFSQQKHAIECAEFPALTFEKSQDQEQRLVFLADNQTIHSTISLTTADIESLKTAFEKRSIYLLYSTSEMEVEIKKSTFTQRRNFYHSQIESESHGSLY